MRELDSVMEFGLYFACMYQCNLVDKTVPRQQTTILSSPLALSCDYRGSYLSVQDGVSLWPPHGIGQAIIFLPCGFFLYHLSSSSFFSSPNLSSHRVYVYHTSTHGVALVQI